MKQNIYFLGLLSLMFAVLFTACEEDEESASDYEDFEELDISVCDPANGPFSLNIDNEFFPLPVGMEAVLEGEEDGESIEVIIKVLDETEDVAGVTTRVVEENESEGGEVVEISRNFFAQAPDGTVCYFGEDVDIYEGGAVVGHEGAWRAGEGQNKPGIIMPGEAKAGVKFAQESAPGVAEDMSAITAMGEYITVPMGDFSDTLRAFDWDPLDGGGGGDVKYYIKGIGLAVDEEAMIVSYVAPQ